MRKAGNKEKRRVMLFSRLRGFLLRCPLPRSRSTWTKEQLVIASPPNVEYTASVSWNYNRRGFLERTWPVRAFLWVRALDLMRVAAIEN
jgi:hypothetical protein